MAQRRLLSNCFQRLSPTVQSRDSTARTQHDDAFQAAFMCRHVDRTTPRSKLDNATSDFASAGGRKRKVGSATRAKQPYSNDIDYDGHTSRFRTKPANPDTSNRRKYGSRRLGPMRERDMYVQWGYIRHQFSGDELLKRRKTFNSWKRHLYNVSHNRKQVWPWQDESLWLLEHKTVSDMRSAWQELDHQSREKQWPRIMLSTMRACPEKAAMVLEATLDPWPPGYAISDVLLFIIQRLDLAKEKNVRERTLKAEQVVGLLHKAIADSPKQHIPFSQRLLGLFAKKLPSEQTSELLALLRQSEINMHANTMIQFASSLARDPAHKQTAFEILQGLSDSGADLNEARPSSVITSLLHCQVPDGVGSVQNPFSPNDALVYFIERGFTLNLLSATAYLDTLSQQGEVDEAIRLALLFSESGVQLDHKAWAIVFRGAKATRKVETVAKALDVAKVADVPIVEVLNNALHSAFHFAETEAMERKSQPRSAPSLFGILLRIYAKKFDLEPLQWWLPESLPLYLARGAGQHGLVSGGATRTIWRFETTIIPFVDQLFSSGDDTKFQPNLTTMAIMMRAYIMGLQQPYDLMAYYQFFKSRLEEQGKDASIPSASRLIQNQGSLIHDTFIFAMTERRELSRTALLVFGDMLKDQLHANGADGEGVHVGSDGVVATTPVHPAPTVLTVTTLLRGLMNHHDRTLVNKIIHVMRENGIQPNLATWNTLVRGYATMQDVPKTVSTLQDMEAAGFKPDSYTFRAFSKLRDQERALQMMEDMIEVSQDVMAQDELQK
ncbi:pentatricopeptide repeat protein [Metarhizium album ARSEF 1941]|uniref:Pentatricopeptide repeat protein n=1 Tax=Metarhizium album (strain ARSEF 1941) TaxID=1081103 RepID=A0A0B2WLK8_METAS|nr:pentatricopeptide repeat protein [Metarhizium album ARSEF 1941]KHN96946.1 pentatricopeptide repeat protein [Metarhizium album ARSEF 1941]